MPRTTCARASRRATPFATTRWFPSPSRRTRPTRWLTAHSAKIAVLAEELDLPVHIHLHETIEEIEESVRRHGERPLARLDRLRLVTERLIAVHAVHLGGRGNRPAGATRRLGRALPGIQPEARQRHCADCGTAGGRREHRPRHRRRGKQRPPRHGLRNASRRPARQGGPPRRQRRSRPPSALEAATLGGARALGLDRRIGSIEAGKDADLAAFDFSSMETQPVYDPVTQLVYAAGREHVSDVWVAGNPVVRGRQVLAEAQQGVTSEAAARVLAWQNRCRQVLQTAGLA